ncbi:MAG: ABC transporter substrate-binding protein [Lachnospiraceae bacterium]|nr:ABC transporter substrate-binding protein [Lachnospiraceae bacterium]
MRKDLKKSLATLLGLAMVVGSMAGCGKSEPVATTDPATDTVTETPAATDTTATETPAATDTAEPAQDMTLVVGYDQFSSKFSPFFATTAYDQDVASMVSVGLLSSDREGNIILKGIEGETVPYNGTDYTYYGIADLAIDQKDDGTVVYDFTMRDDLKFSDGEPITADDVIFSMYVLSDPMYDGSSTFYSLPIKGMADYRSNMGSQITYMLQAGRDNTDFTFWDEATQTAFWASLDEAGAAFVQEIMDYLVAAGYNTADDTPAACIANWGFDAPEDATATDVFNIMLEAYDYDLATLSSTESAGTPIETLMADYDTYNKTITVGDSADHIEGIEKTGDYSIRITMDSFDAVAIYQLGVTVAPLHYYGDPSLYDYDNNKFGFVKGDMSLIKSKTLEPLGAGAYKFVSYENGVVTFEANENYYKGEPKIKYINFKETQAADKLTGVAQGTFDVSDPSMSLEVLGNIKGYNSNGEITGDVLTTSLVDNLGYGYIGISASNVKVGDQKDSEASKSLRKAFATLFACYRDTVINSYYGEMATVIQYPISNTSWAAPKPADDGYRLAYSVDADGNDIYTSDMTDEQKSEAALAAAVSFLKAAGYTYDEASGQFTAAPEGAEMTYEVIIPGGGTGDHPAYGVLTAAKEALASVGITLEINDPSDANILWDALDADTADMWAAAWGATVDPDMYQIYHSSNYMAGTTSNHYSITSDELDELIVAARESADQSYRKATYKECLEIILDWAVEVPTYQRQNAIVFSTERVNMDTVTPDITTFWSWMNDIELLEMN